jgi:sulfur relay (sulfurtransferase) complex TusBCD TusD component (DsrE family)
MANTLVILNDPPYGTERDYNGLRLAGALAIRQREEVKVFLIGDAVSGANAAQNVAHGHYSSEVDAPRRRQTWRRNRGVRYVHGCARHDRDRADRRSPSKHARPARGLDAVGRQDHGVLSDRGEL